jgi:chromosome segregation ATPase
MARGITAEEVRAAADDLLAAGERPTAERVRLALGRGSPNTIGPMLETWWSTLAQRLRAQLALPNVPAELGSAFAQVWAQALAAGQTHAEGLVAPERAALAEVVARTEAAAAAQQASLAELDAQLQQAQAAQRGVEAALAISEQRGTELKADLLAAGEQLQALARQHDAAQSQLHEAAANAERARAAHAAERDNLLQQLRQVEDRAYGEVDRARQELKVMKAQLTAQARDHASALRTSEQQRRVAEAALATSKREAARRMATTARRAPPAKRTAAPAKRRKTA